MAENFSLPRGTADILPSEIPVWQYIEKRARFVLEIYHYKEIRTPLFEETSLFQRSLGQTSDVVNKQLLSLTSDKKEGFSLRPEGTASVVRAYTANSIDRKEQLSKFFYIGPMFRGERPQKGRLRQFHQIGVEVIGPTAEHPFIDAEVIALNVYLLKSFGLIEFSLKLNTLGSLEDKEHFSLHLRKLLKTKVSDLCEDCRNRLERNVFRILDCKNKMCRNIIAGLNIDHSHLSPASRSYFQNVTEALDGLGVKYQICHDLVRGLDYYTHTVFEITASSLGSQDALSAGGRYNHLVKQLGGSQVPAMGFALGIERVILSLPEQALPTEPPLDVFVVAAKEHYVGKAFKLVQMLRTVGIMADMGFQTASLKSHMRQANKKKALAVVLIGNEEDQNDTVTLKNMGTGDQKIVSVDNLISEIEQCLQNAKEKKKARC